jgi:hypothetical protein
VNSLGQEDVDQIIVSSGGEVFAACTLCQAADLL